MMFKRASEMSHVFTEHQMGGEGTCEVINILEGEELHNASPFVGVTRVPVGATIGMHKHVGDFETYYILRGKARVTVEDTTVDLEPGDATQCEDGESHCIANIGDEELVYISVKMFSRN